MDNQVLVSVIIPTYNRKTYVVRAIDSVLAQSYKNVEIIVVDDCSKDDTYEVLLQMQKKHPNLVAKRNDVNLGPAGTANAGIEAARGKYIAILDDDDIWSDRKKLEKQVDFLEKNNEYVLVGGGVIKVDVQGKEITRYVSIERDADIRKILLINNVFAHSSVLFRKEAFLKTGGYQKDLKYFADWDLWLKLGTIGKFYNFQEFFYHYLDQEQGKSRTTHDYGIRRRLWANIALRKKYQQYYPGYYKSVLLCLAAYVYSFIPFRKVLLPAIYNIRKFFFGASPYTYFNEK